MTTANTTYLDGRVRLCIGDITELSVDAIVNAANRGLLGGGGVDGAIHRRGGPAILEACHALRATRWPDGLPTGQAVITTGGNLSARYVIHTVGPIFGRHDGAEARLLAACYRNSMALAAEYQLKSIAFPAISTGVYGYPQEEAAGIVSRTLRQTLDQIAAVDDLQLVFFSAEQLDLFVSHQQFDV